MYVEGTMGKDYYQCSRIGNDYLTRQYTINDKGSLAYGDVLELQGINAKQDDFRFFFDVDKNGNIIGKDLYLLGYNDDNIDSNLANFILGWNAAGTQQVGLDTDVPYLKIENYFGAGEIETIKDGQVGWKLDKTMLSQIASDVAGWLNNYNNLHNTDYSCITDAIADNHTDINLVNTYIADSSWQGGWS